ncbi:MAG: acyloxyacyl hydrolase [Pseudomonadota bacterium]
MELSVSVGEADSRFSFPEQGKITSDTYRLGFIVDTGYSWQFFENQTLKLELETGVHRWEDALLENNKTGAYLTPMWRYYFERDKFSPYIAIGVGASYTDDDEFMDRKLGSRLLFEDRFEVGAVLYDVHRISLSINHYSNADLADINHGVNLYYLNYAYRLKDKK